MAQKLSKGRQKIELKRIENEEDRLITFSKRRSGIYKKATELSTLCGVEIGVLVFSPSGKAFTYGVPCLEVVADRLLHRNNNNNNSSTSQISHGLQLQRSRSAGGHGLLLPTGTGTGTGSGTTRIQEMNAAYDELSARLERLKKEGEELARKKRGIQDKCWWDAVVEDLNAHEVEQFTGSMEELRRTADEILNNLQINKMISGANSYSSSNSSSSTNNSAFSNTTSSSLQNGFSHHDNKHACCSLHQPLN
ncbi:hypothetical protein Dimus_031008 [Dionaea muscipula]